MVVSHCSTGGGYISMAVSRCSTGIYLFGARWLALLTHSGELLSAAVVQQTCSRVDVCECGFHSLVELFL